jgi:hypothetical protein
MSDIKPEHDHLFEEGLKLVNDALVIFMELKSGEGTAISKVLHGALMLGEIAYAGFKK